MLIALNSKAVEVGTKRCKIMIGIKTYPTPKGIHSMNMLSIIYLGKIGVKYIIISYISPTGPTLDTLYSYDSYVFSLDISKSLLISKDLSTRDKYLKCQAHFQQIPLTKRSFMSAVIGGTHTKRKEKPIDLLQFKRHENACSCICLQRTVSSTWSFCLLPLLPRIKNYSVGGSLLNFDQGLGPSVATNHGYVVSLSPDGEWGGSQISRWCNGWKLREGFLIQAFSDVVLPDFFQIMTSDFQIREIKIQQFSFVSCCWLLHLTILTKTPPKIPVMIHHHGHHRLHHHQTSGHLDHCTPKMAGSFCSPKICTKLKSSLFERTWHAGSKLGCVYIYIYIYIDLKVFMISIPFWEAFMILNRSLVL